ncbi:hypothetical protein CXU22_06645 [Akkermansia muciniphila]|uniref:Uncharacterized protein n=1 Tax=Akkermansia muciniphila TaxID=239935 RepID=A0A2N8HEE8_9BACT|nr:hypothetical protein CXU21_00120 [Akkermansia muciniphila]PNC18299.1 hypothetical protein CXU22_06645 [Akkermansia muciniphila]
MMALPVNGGYFHTCKNTGFFPSAPETALPGKKKRNSARCFSAAGIICWQEKQTGCKNGVP